jgi:hypothetical protein
MVRQTQQLLDVIRVMLTQPTPIPSARAASIRFCMAQTEE